MRDRIQIFAVVVAAVSLTTLSAAPILADPWGTDTADTGAHPDADPHTYCYGSGLASGAKPNIDAAEWDALDPTAANADYQSSCDLSSSTETDVVWFTGNLSSGVRGEEYCEDYDTHCDQFYATLDLGQIDGDDADHPEMGETKSACHELGHTAGLTHHDDGNDCMDSGPLVSTDLQYRRYSSHHIDHIAGWF
jgi:hypothetical protein